MKELEKRGIGRPSTCGNNLHDQDRGYVKLDTRRFYAEKIGEVVTDRLVENFDDLLDYAFTAQMEERLDAVAEGDVPWKQVLDTFYTDFSRPPGKGRAGRGGHAPQRSHGNPHSLHRLRSSHDAPYRLHGGLSRVL